MKRPSGGKERSLCLSSQDEVFFCWKNSSPVVVQQHHQNVRVPVDHRAQQRRIPIRVGLRPEGGWKQVEVVEEHGQDVVVAEGTDDVEGVLA